MTNVLTDVLTPCHDSHMDTNKDCRRCSGTGRTAHSYAGGICRACGGTGTKEARDAGKDAAARFISWATEEGARREVGARASYAAHAARHLQRTAPERFAKAMHHRNAGRGDAVYAALVALADEVASR